MNIIASWKELLIFFTLFMIVLFNLQFRNIYKFKLNPVDTIVSIYFLLNIFYLILSITIMKSNVGISATLNGFRIQAMVLFSYITARFVSGRDKGNILKYLRVLIIIGTMVSVFGIIERFINPLPFLNGLGMKEYLMEVGGLNDKEFTKEGGVQTYYANFNTEDGKGTRWRRSASLFLSPLVFSQVLIIIIPISLVLVLNKKSFKWHLLIQIAGLLSSISRGPIIAIVVSSFSLLLFIKSGISKKQKRIFILIFSLFVGLVINKGADFIVATVSLKDSSAFSRANTYYNSIQFMIEHPFGVGLWASDSKFNKEEVEGGGESEYFENVSRIGWIGLALYLFMHFVIIKKSYQTSKSKNTDVAILSAIVFGITVGLFTQEFTNRIWKNAFLPYTYGWIVGVWVTYYINEKKTRRSCPYAEDAGNSS